MKISSTLKRFALLMPEALICGPSYAKFLFLARSSPVLDSEKVWEHFTQHTTPFWEFFLNHYPPAIVRQILCDFYVSFTDRIAGVSKHYDISSICEKLRMDATCQVLVYKSL